MTTVTSILISTETVLPADFSSTSAGSTAPRTRMQTVECSSGRRELWLLAIVLITGILMAAAVLLPAVLT
ncbi:MULTISPECIES: hypothetical protein [Nocardiaceae]|uniref:Uncharacterized protein n=1 Tax=Rhodococcoides corynebacterioides TaxID=53972 RepID=A0ABS2KW93_9NOCA|nr:MULTISPECIES: hypothetical protein [Rhodococcus]KQU36279.1 hypothetical protein ASG69_18565 [Rhodococcus sp. Leaf225]KQU48827.1 hypothetical protein ASH03_03040 [Rhodococcus sp. Leaf258]MBM7416188.1 hypothetical protein [Rhodococcus corynebacterioides]MBP1114441.1 hypothetical protein [Rhodococcus sp. PvP016]MBY6676893.1 hypothetical protein [Rhodococcus sp. BP-332]